MTHAALQVTANLRDSLYFFVRDTKVILVSQATFTFQFLQMRRPESPVTFRLSRNDMEMKMRHLLAAADAVILV